MTAEWLPGMETEQRRRDLSQFYTKPELATRVWRWMWSDDLSDPYGHATVLEPSAGRGALIKPVLELGLRVSHLVAYEVDPANVEVLKALMPSGALGFEIEQLAQYEGTGYQVRERDFLADPDPGHFDLSIFNTPFEDGQDVAFAEKICGCTERAAGIMPASIFYAACRQPFWRWHDPVRAAFLAERPGFGGEYSPMTNFVVLELRRRAAARLQGEATPMVTEWWT